ncbi:polyamine ABC transporter substrate-binding protein [Hyphomicrobium sp.]|jgi:putrescine transport system substrate-binding protein|uniref:polyamine ABC transporter substrate-binding protein n=1 Tax=Hyphomicrobium sp. TaxID=82 RepID=UPI002CE52900|nr:polyamine ABC transporter substrate-binding protein [Hyphomicrobium sp.]HVZ03751.1 polyamine ABC transporter substrate-binding protein [Hyphomicrobium sp.]
MLTFGKVARRAVYLFAAIASLISGQLICQQAGAEEKVVRVYNWSDYIDPSILTDFTKETGIKVVYDVFDSNEVLETKLLAGGSGYDVVVPTGPFLSRQIAAGVFQKLDKSKLPNLANMWPEIMKQLAIYDPGNQYAINYMWGTTGIGYNAAKVKERMANAPVDSWDLVFNPDVISKFKDCGVMMLDAPDDILPAALNYLGLDPNSNKPADIEKAGALLEKVRPYVRKFHSSEYINALANGDICIAVGYSGDILQARSRAQEAKNGQEIVYSLPKQGAQMWFDEMAIPADAKHPEEAHIFLNYMMKPEVIAKASNYVSYANGNLASQKMLDDTIKSDKSIYPDADTMKRLFVKTAYDPKTQRVVTRTWTKVITGQ